MDEAAAGPPECRCGLPMLALPLEFWACATCDQGVSGGTVVASGWFRGWQLRRRGQLDAEGE